MGFCKDLIYALLGRGCGVSRNDESVDTLVYITWQVVAAQRIYFKLNTYFTSITTNILQEKKTIEEYLVLQHFLEYLFISMRSRCFNYKYFCTF